MYTRSKIVRLSMKKKRNFEYNIFYVFVRGSTIIPVNKFESDIPGTGIHRTCITEKYKKKPDKHENIEYTYSS